MSRLHEQYQSEVRGDLTKEFGYANPMQVPRLSKIIVNMGVGEASQDRKKIDGAVQDLTLITGQKPIITKAKKSIAAFKLRDGMTVGCKVTLRNEYMYEFLDRLVNVALPRVRDFRGLSPKSFDGKGNYALGLKEQIVFPEIDYDKVDAIRGMDIVICTTAETDDEARALLRCFNMPFSGRDLEAEAAKELEKKAALEAAKQAARDALKEEEGETAADQEPGDTGEAQSGNADGETKGEDGNG